MDISNFCVRSLHYSMLLNKEIVMYSVTYFFKKFLKHFVSHLCTEPYFKISLNRKVLEWRLIANLKTKITLSLCYRFSQPENYKFKTSRANLTLFQTHRSLYSQIEIYTYDIAHQNPLVEEIKKDFTRRRVQPEMMVMLIFYK